MECTPETFESESSSVDIDAMITVFEAGCKVSSGSAGGITNASAPKDDDASSESDGEDGDGGKVDSSGTIASGSRTAGGSSASPSGTGAADGEGAGFMIQPRYISAALVGAVVAAVAFA